MTKRLKITAVVIAVVFTNPLLYNVVLYNWQWPVISSSHPYQKRSAAILLTGISVGNSKHERFFNGAATDRFIQAARLYHKGLVPVILINGGNGSLNRTIKPEAYFLQQMLLDDGIDPKAIMLEPESRNTYESAKNAKKILDSTGIENNYWLVTSASHMRRALAVYRKAGLNVYPVPSAYELVELRWNWNWIMPHLSLLERWQVLLKEMVGYAVYAASGKL